MGAKYYKEESKKNWYTEMPVTNEDLQTGCLQRIADATELMASNYLKLQADLESWKKWGKEKQAKLEAAERRIIALKGVITKLKKKSAKTNQ